MAVLDERLYRILEKDKLLLQEQVFSHPPKTMEEFAKRLGQWHQINATLTLMVEHATQDPEERKDLKS